MKRAPSGDRKMKAKEWVWNPGYHRHWGLGVSWSRPLPEAGLPPEAPELIGWVLDFIETICWLVGISPLKLSSWRGEN